MAVANGLPTCRGFWVYGLMDPRSGRVRYVGKAQGYLNTRLRNHLREAATTNRVTHKLAWLRSLSTAGVEPRVCLLASAQAAEELADIERWWIAHLRENGADLVNMTEGGEGMPNPSPETRAKLRARPVVPFTPETREKCRQIMLERWATPEWQAKMAAIQDARRVERPPKLTAEERAQRRREVGARNRGKPKSAATRAKLSEALRRAHAEGRAHRNQGPVSEETRAKLRAAWVRRKAVMPR